MKLDVPFFKQTTALNCGPVALQMVLSYFGDKTDLKKIEDLVKQGLIKETDPEYKNYGGAYVVSETGGKYSKFFDENQLRNYAVSQNPKAPNKWKRGEANTNNKNNGTKTNFVEGKTYVDKSGNKAKYVGGKWVEETAKPNKNDPLGIR